MIDAWLFGYRKCRIISQVDDGQVRIKLENGCTFVVHRALVYEDRHEKDYLTKHRHDRKRR